MSVEDGGEAMAPSKRPAARTINPLSLTTVRVESLVDGEASGSGTGFFYRSEDGQALFVTNWHVVTGGLDPQHPGRLRRDWVPPTQLRLVVHKRLVGGQIAATELVEIVVDINDEAGEHPKWFEHPEHGPLVDVVVIELEEDEEMTSHVGYRCVEAIPDLQPAYWPKVMDDAYVLGYPRGLSAGGQALPVYKRASIASEPAIDFLGLPRLLIDGTTDVGLSGGPVIAVTRNLWSPTGDLSSRDTDLNGARNFIGVYSGRLTSGMNADGTPVTTPSELPSNLGVVWKRSALDEIIVARRPGAPLCG